MALLMDLATGRRPGDGGRKISNTSITRHGGCQEERFFVS